MKSDKQSLGLRVVPGAQLQAVEVAERGWRFSFSLEPYLLRPEMPKDLATTIGIVLQEALKDYYEHESALEIFEYSEPVKLAISACRKGQVAATKSYTTKFLHEINLSDSFEQVFTKVPSLLKGLRKTLKNKRCTEIAVALLYGVRLDGVNAAALTDILKVQMERQARGPEGVQ